MHSTLFGTVGRARKAVVLFLALAMAVLAGPAGAQNDDAGSGSGSGEEESITTEDHIGPGPPPFCLEVTESSYYVDVVGTFTATDGEGNTAVYEGPARLEYETNDTYYIGPEGTYTDADAEDGCDVNSLGEGIDTTVRVVESPALPSTGGSITCPADEDGEYFRLASDVTVQWEADCTVNGNAPAPFDGEVMMGDVVSHLFTGELDAASGTLIGTWEYPDPTR